MKNVIKKMFGQKGFSLPEVLIAVGIMGGMSLLVTQVANQTSRVTKSAVTNTNTYSMLNDIQAIIKDPRNCEANLRGKLVSDPLTMLITVDRPPSTTERIRYEVGKDYEGGTVRLTNVSLSRSGTETFVNISIQKSGNKKEQGLNPTVISKSISINAEYDSGGRIVSCQSNVVNHVDGAVTAALEKICSGMNMNYDSATRRCSTDPQIGENLATDPTMTCPNGETLVSVEYATGKYRPQCKDSVGMNVSCNDRQILRRNLDKTFTCVDISCDVNGMFMGLDSTGAAICFTCPVGSSPIFASGAMQCKPLSACANSSGGSGQYYMAGYDSNGDPICNPLVDASAAACSNGTLAVRADGSLYYNCCTPDCSDASNQCSGANFESANGCGQCSGTKPANCSDSGNYCSGTSYAAADGCGICSGTKLPINATWSDWSPCVNGSRSRTCSNNQACGGSGCTGPSIEACAPPAPKGVCQGYGSDTSKMFITGSADTGSCEGKYRYQYFDIVVSEFKVGNIYTITRGESVSEEAKAGDTPRTVLDRLAARINSAGISATGACGASNNYARVISANRIEHRVQWQHSAGISASRSCNIADEASCTATPGCSWNTTSAYVCTGWNYQVPQGRCNGTYYAEACGWDGYTGDPSNEYNCQYGYSDAESCNAQWSKGCRWGSVAQTCYAGTQAECISKSGCSWKAYPSMHRSCTAASWDTACKNDGAGICTWRPRE